MVMNETWIIIRSNDRDFCACVCVWYGPKIRYQTHSSTPQFTLNEKYNELFDYTYDQFWYIRAYQSDKKFANMFVSKKTANRVV